MTLTDRAPATRVLVLLSLLVAASCAVVDPELTTEELHVFCDGGVEPVPRVDGGVDAPISDRAGACAPATTSAKDLDGVPSWVADKTPADGLPNYTNVNNPFVGGCVMEWNNGNCNGNPATTNRDLCGTNGLDEQIASDAAGLTATTDQCLPGGKYAGAGMYSDCALECKQAQAKLGLARNGGTCTNANSNTCGGNVGRCVCDPAVVTTDLIN